MIEKWGVDVRLGVEATAQTILAEKPDVIVIAAGAAPVMPAIEGLEAARKAGRVLIIDEAMAREPAANIGQSVVIWGAAEGAELAIDMKLAGKNVRLLDKGPAYAPANYIGSRVWAIMGYMGFIGLSVEGGRTPKRMNSADAVFATADGEETVTADTFILCPGRAPNDALARALKDAKVPVQVIGDARAPRSYANAIHEAAYLVRQI